MVSIPDWSRFRGMTGEKPQRAPASPTKLQNRRGDDVIRQAEEQGYFNVPSSSFIKTHCLPPGDPPAHKPGRSLRRQPQRDLSEVTLLSLPNTRLRSLGDIGLCHRLRVCILCDNYISHFDALAQCTELVKLDLHSNQINVLPGPSFWASMRKLCILNLHDNPIGQLESLHSLAACPSLSVTTLHNTPLSLKRNYRHHVVNSIWTLKALDHHVISDEEIIEDADFEGSFSCLNKAFKLKLHSSPIKGGSVADELRGVRRVLADINRILAHNSPVLILQRYIRGYLLRKRYKLVQDMRIWAAVTIQRKYREWKGIETPRTQVPPPPSPVTEHKVKVIPGTHTVGHKLDYDTYLRNRRPGSAAGLSEAGSHTSDKNREQMPPPSSPAQEPISSAQTKRKNIFINLAKLQAGTLHSLQDEAGSLELYLSSDLTDDHTTSRPEPHRVRKKKPVEKKRRVAKSVKQFFGPVVESVSTPEPEQTRSASVYPDEDEIPVISFRLRGRHQKVEYYDPTTDMILSRQEAGREVRAAEDEFHRKIVREPKPAPKLSQTSHDQRMFARVQGTMGLTCLQAIQQAYRDREKSERRVARLESVMSLREQRDDAKERIRLYQEEKRQRVMCQRETDQRRLMDHLQRQELQRQGTMDCFSDLHKKSAQKQKLRRDEQTFVSDFSVQNTSVSNALLRHDRQARVEDHSSDKMDNVLGQRHLEQEQHEVVQKYLEHRQLMRQTESAMARAAVDTKMLQEASDRLLQARSRVAHQKAMTESVQAFCPLPAVASNSLADLPTEHRTSSLSMKNFEKWQTSRLARFNTVAT